MMRPLTPCLLVLLSACIVDGDCPDDETSTTDTATKAAPLSCAEVDRAMDGETTVPTGEAEITLSGVYRVSDTVTFDAGEVVTIEPGTVFLSLRFSEDVTLMASDGFHPGPGVYAEWGRRAGNLVMVKLSVQN